MTGGGGAICRRAASSATQELDIIIPDEITRIRVEVDTSGGS